MYPTFDVIGHHDGDHERRSLAVTLQYDQMVSLHVVAGDTLTQIWRNIDKSSVL